ncbi:MAG: M17 family peptidase N-terminal domain-containing protein [Polyangiaceae bacterium]
MELRFILPNLRRLDLAGTEVLLANLTEDERPIRGLAGLLDFRLQGKLSNLLASGFATGSLGEVLLLPGKPALAFDKLILFGLGPKSAFGDQVYRDVLERMLSTLEGIRARSAVVELPGRHFGAIGAEEAATILLDTVAQRPDHDLWTLVEPNEAQQIITQQVIVERRRMRK